MTAVEKLQLVGFFFFSLGTMLVLFLGGWLLSLLPAKEKIGAVTDRSLRNWLTFVRYGGLMVSYAATILGILVLAFAVSLPRHRLETFQEEVGYAVVLRHNNDQEIVYLNEDGELEKIDLSRPPQMTEYPATTPWDRAVPTTFIRGKDLRHPVLVTIR